MSVVILSVGYFWHQRISIGIDPRLVTECYACGQKLMMEISDRKRVQIIQDTVIGANMALSAIGLEAK